MLGRCPLIAFPRLFNLLIITQEHKESAEDISVQCDSITDPEKKRLGPGAMDWEALMFA
jgi:hypothetical protein